mmetsp:Transcript_17276/g.26414  ORF Transcript_17276/g.26414 Transcript_17276/m.26414 type:complete len:242 (+) Transcript_17276:37-762(+)
MKLTLLFSLASTAAAFAPTKNAGRVNTQVSSSMDELKEIAGKANPIIKYFDPLNLAEAGFFDTEDEVIGFLRQAEVKHGRVAMAAFVGYCVQSNGIRWPFPETLSGDPYPSSDLSPPEQWDALPYAAKFQIIVFIGFLEWWSEYVGTHYMRGGKPGAFPAFSDNKGIIPHPLPLNLYDPFGFSKNRSEEAKASGLIKEINNGRLAMLGIIGFLSEQKIAGSVPLLTGIVKPYAGEPMAPFA